MHATPRTKFVYNARYVAPFVAVPKPHPDVAALVNQDEPQYTPVNGTGRPYGHRQHVAATIL